MSEEKKILIFYSWQSDLPKDTNQKAIRNALNSAHSIIEEKLDIRIALDEATRGESGSPNIPGKIQEKISMCDVFVCDLTTINSKTDESVRKTPNPNVLFELGYAVATLGWGRIIMLFNKNFGKFPDDLPFDIDRHRASPFILSEEDPKNKSNISDLQELLKGAIVAVVENNPKRPSDMLLKTPEELRHIRDIKNLTWALSTINIPIIDRMVLELPRYLYHKVFHFWESFRSVVKNSLFHLYDEDAKKLIEDVFIGWQGCVDHGEQYRMAENPHLYVFSNPGDAPLNENQEQAWSHIEESRSLLKVSLEQLLAHVRSKYIEIDVEELSGNAWKEYVAYTRNLL